MYEYVKNVIKIIFNTIYKVVLSWAKLDFFANIFHQSTDLLYTLFLYLSQNNHLTLSHNDYSYVNYVAENGERKCTLLLINNKVCV